MVKNKNVLRLACSVGVAWLPLYGAEILANEVGVSMTLEEIVVTGSRISRTGYDSPTPTNVINQKSIANSGFGNVGDIAVRSPSFGVGLGSGNANFNDDAGAAFVNLRGLGIDRTLVLVNGRRRVAGSTLTSAVDLSTIPSGMVERIEVVTGGASAVYGADAVTGVMNVILKDDFEGLEISGRGGFSTEGSGGENYSVNLFGGSQFADGRGSITFGGSYNKDEPLTATGRDFSDGILYLFANGANTGPNDGIPDSIHYPDFRLPGTHGAGTFVIAGDQYTVDPNLRLIQNDVIYPIGFIASGGDGYDPALYTRLRTEVETVSTMSTVNYDLTDKTKLFIEAQFSSVDVIDPRNPSSFDNNIVLDRANPFIPADVGTLMDANSLTQLSMQRTHNDHGLETNNLDKTTYTLLGGFEGELSDSWNWQAFYQYGQYTYNSQMENVRVNSRFLEAIDVISDPVTGSPICQSADARAAGCEPLNVIGSNVASQQALNYILHTRLRNSENTQKIVGLQIDGDLFDLPAGTLKVASGLEYRKESLSIRDDGLALAGDLFFTSGQGTPDTDSSFDVVEGFVEALLPIAKDKRFIEDLNIETAVRFSDYDTIGSTVAWKFGGDWSPTEGVRFRATRSKSVRAPNLSELFSPGVGTFALLVDPCDIANINDNANRATNCASAGIPAGFVDPTIAAADPISVGGNIDLDPETSQSWTAGVVITPEVIEDLSFSIDYWNIEITDAINTINAQTALDKCYDAQSLNNPFCSLINRRGDSGLSLIELSDINIGELTAAGVDVEVNYTMEAFGGTVDIAATGTYLIEHEEFVDKTDSTTLIIRDGEVSHPRVRLNLITSYSQGPWDIGLSTRFVGSSKADVQALPEDRDLNNASSKIYNDLVFGYELNENYQFSLGINNLFNVTPPRLFETHTGGGGAGLGQGEGGGGLYDNIGRYIFLGASAKF